MITKSFPAVEFKVVDESRGQVAAIFSVTSNVDRQGDKILPGAFKMALAAKQSVPVVWAHQWSDINAVLGRTLSMAELMPGDPGLPQQLRAKGYGGVKANIQFEMEAPAGRIAFTHLKHQNVKDFSFAFDLDEKSFEYDEDGHRNIKNINELFEVTVALVGANPETLVAAMKQMALDTSPSRRVPDLSALVGSLVARRFQESSADDEPAYWAHKRSTCYHEASHAVVATALGARVTEIRSWSGMDKGLSGSGYCSHLSRLSDYLEAVIGFAGAVGVARKFGRDHVGSGVSGGDATEALRLSRADQQRAVKDCESILDRNWQLVEDVADALRTDATTYAQMLLQRVA